jgi:pimeloyl-ACP methyl ester carboxylesterase
MPLFRFSELLRIMLEWAYRRRSPEKTEFDKPALQIHATNDWLLPIRSTNPDIRIGSGGHLIPFTHSEKINAIIEGFVAGLGTPS